MANVMLKIYMVFLGYEFWCTGIQLVHNFASNFTFLIGVIYEY